MSLYSPSTVELNNAIEGALKANSKATWKDVQKTLKKQNPTWKLIDRRMNKFVKRQKAGNPVDESDDNRSMRSMTRLFSSRSSNKTSKSKNNDNNNNKSPSPSVVTATDNEEASLQLSSTLDTETISSSPTACAVASPPIPNVVEEKMAEEIYKDDNDGKKKFSCWCF